MDNLDSNLVLSILTCHRYQTRWVSPPCRDNNSVATSSPRPGTRRSSRVSNLTRDNSRTRVNSTNSSRSRRDWILIRCLVRSK